MIIKDAMVVIHLAKIALLEKSCIYFKEVLIPRKVYSEVIKDEESCPEVRLIKNLIDKNKIMVKEVKNKELIEKVNQFNIQGGEAEAVAIYWQENADYLATDDDNVRKKKHLLDLRVVGTPAMILKLYKEKMINKEKFIDSLGELRKIGWFSSTVIDKLLMET